MQNRYNYVFDGITNTYNFTTKNDILYRVAFLVDETFSAIAHKEISNIFQLVIEKITDNREPLDAKVSTTIEHIVEQFFRKAENSLVYVCSEDDDKAALRFEVFDRWYKKSKYKDLITKIDNVIRVKITETDYEIIYTSFMFHKENPNYPELIEIYRQLEKSINEK